MPDDITNNYLEISKVFDFYSFTLEDSNKVI